jgi:glyoxalase superfamily protein
MAVAYKVVFDAVDPHSQAFFWADVLGYVVEDNTAFIRSLLDAGAITDADVTEFDGRLFFSSGAAARDPYSPVDERGVGLGGRVLFLAVPEHKTTKNRVHLDVHVGADKAAAEVTRLVELGATVLYRVDEPGSRHVTLADPEGNEFCVM